MKRTLHLICLLLVFCLCLTGCGAASSAPMEQYSSAGWTNSADYAVSEKDYAADEPGRTADVRRKLVRTVSLRVQTTDFDATTRALVSCAEELGGYIASSSVWGNAAAGDERSASYLVRIPAQRCDEFLSAAENAGNVTRRSEQLEDITTRYVDNAAHLESLQIEQQRLQELLAQAKNLEEILLLEERLADVRAQLESAERQQRYYDDQVDYATIELDISEVSSLTPAKDDFFSQLKQAFFGSFEGLAQLLRTVILAVVYWWWALLGLAVVVRVIYRRRKAKKQAKNTAANITEETNKS